jgi:hypothetical protein
MKTWGLLFLLSSAVPSATAGPPTDSQTQLVSTISSSCQGVNLEDEGYVIGTVTTRGPFDFPWWKNSHSTASNIAAKLHGKKFTYDEAVRKVLTSLRNISPTPSGAAEAFHISVAFVQAERCSNGVVDLLYQIYTIPPRNLLSGSTEWSEQAEKAPQDAVGLTTSGQLTNTGHPFRLAPAADFNGWKQVLAGGELSYDRQNLSIQASGAGSTSAYHAYFATAGTHNYVGSITRLDWSINAASMSNPIDRGTLGDTQFSGLITATTRTFASGRLLARFGGMLQGGELHSRLASATLPANTVTSADVVSEKLYAGVSLNAPHNSLAISSGGEFGSVLVSGGGNWRKVIGDAVDDFWWSLPDHHPLEIEMRFSGGGIPSYRSIPLPDRFFGGDMLKTFIPGESWQINSEPFIRAIPANNLSLTGAGTGATNFLSLNLTISYPIWQKPLIPQVIQSEIEPLLAGQLTSATSMLQNNYAATDPRVKGMLDHVDAATPVLDRLNNEVSSFREIHQGSLPSTFDNCTGYITFAKMQLNKLASQKSDKDKYPTASTMPSTLGTVVQNCSVLEDPAIKAAASQLDEISKLVVATDATLQPDAHKRAVEAVSFSRRTINTVLQDLNIISIAPVGVLDWAKIGPSGNGGKDSRIGPGGGVRVELATFVNFTLGYAANINHQLQEPRGALFFEMSVRDLFH